VLLALSLQTRPGERVDRQARGSRDPKVDAVNWVERITLAEMRNYVQRVTRTSSSSTFSSSPQSNGCARIPLMQLRSRRCSEPTSLPFEPIDRPVGCACGVTLLPTCLPQRSFDLALLLAEKFQPRFKLMYYK
jgi:hypothetical protein